MKNLNYDVLSYIFDFLSEKDAYHLTITSKSIYSIVKNQGFLKTISLNESYPGLNFQGGFEMMSMMYMHKRRLTTIHINLIDDPVPWMPFWPRTVHFRGCSFYRNTIDPKKKVMTENLYIKRKWGYHKEELVVRYENFPKLKNIFIE